MTELAQRVVGDVFQTPIAEYNHPKTGSTIGYVGMMHVGTPDYFEQARGYVNEREAAGSLVHYEGTKQPSAEELAASGVDPELYRRFSAGIDATYDFVGKRLGLSFQSDIITPGKNWQNHDISRLEVMQLLGDEVVQRIAGEADKLAQQEAALGPDRMLRIMTGALRHVQLASTLAKVLPAVGGGRHIQRVVYDHRDGLELAAIDSALAQEPGRDITVLRGARHLPGIGKGLRDRGYERTGTQWLDAFTLPKKK